MIVYVDLEHSRLRQEPATWRFFASQTLETKYRLEAISGASCLIVHYTRVTPALLRQLDAQAVVAGGHYTGLWHYAPGDLVGLQAVFRDAAWPTLGMCGGFHLMLQTYGAQVGPMQDTQHIRRPPCRPGYLAPAPRCPRPGRNAVLCRCACWRRTPYCMAWVASRSFFNCIRGR
jgi:hypothetical protein